jgi:phosphohistidine phosphatase
MRQLLLLRHAKSSHGDMALSDHARGLDGAGLQAASAMRRAMRELGLVPDMVLVSSARRTLETLEALEPWDETPLIETMDALYLATSVQILSLVRAVPETVRSLMVVGHNPGVHDLALTLAGPHGMSSNRHITRSLADGFPAGALAEFTVASHWRDVMVGGGQLVRFLAPKDLREMAG